MGSAQVVELQGQALVVEPGALSFPSLVTGPPPESSGLLRLDALARGLQLWASG